MKKLITLLSLFPFLIFSQNEISDAFTIELSEPIKSVESLNDRINKWYYDESEYSLSYSNKTIALKLNKNDLYLRIYNSSLKIISDKKYDNFNSDFNMIRVLEFGEKHFLVYSKYDKTEESDKIYFREIDIEKGVLNDAKIVYSGVSFVPPFFEKEKDYYWTPNYGGLKFNISQNKSKLLLEIFNGSKEIKIKRGQFDNYKKYTYVAIDNDLNILWTNYQETLTEYKREILSTCFTNDGVYKVLKYDNDNSKLSLSSISKESKQPERIDLELDNSFMFSGARLIEKPNGNLFVVGLYGVSYLTLNARGVYYYEIDKDGEIIEEKQVPFDEDLYYSHEKDEFKKMDDRNDKVKGLRNLVLRDVVLNKDGSFYVVSEVRYNIWDATLETDIYKFGNIVVAKIDINNDEFWVRKLPKLQRTVYRYGRDASFKHFVSDENIYFVYIDNDKNSNLDENALAQEHFISLGGRIRIVKIEDSGDMINYPVLKMKNSTYGSFSYFQVKKIQKEKDEENFYIELNRKNSEDYLLKINLK